MLRCDFKSWYVLCVRARVWVCTEYVHSRRINRVPVCVSMWIIYMENFQIKFFSFCFTISANQKQTRWKSSEVYNTLDSCENKTWQCVLWMECKLTLAKWEQHRCLLRACIHNILRCMFESFNVVAFFPFKKFMSNSRRCTTHAMRNDQPIYRSSFNEAEKYPTKLYTYINLLLVA